MSKYEDFDLDFEVLEDFNSLGNGEPGAKSAWACVSDALSQVTEAIITNSGCPITDGCTNATCSACHSYCGGSCRRR